MDEPTKELLAHYRAENARLVGERDRLWAENRRLWLAVAKLQRATGQFYSLSLQNVIPCEGAHESAFDSCTDADEILDGLVALDPAGDGK